MSRITAVDPFWLRRPPDALSPRQEEIFLLRLTTEDGRQGWGEAHGSPYLLRAAIRAPVTHVSAQGLVHVLRGADATDVPRLRHAMDRATQWIGRDGVVAQAIAAAEMALWDLEGQRQGRPVWQLLRALDGLDARVGAAMRCYASGKVAATPERTHARLAGERAAGFAGAKIGWPPFGADLAGDIAYLEAARDATGPDMALMVDAAQAWDLPQARAALAGFARFSLGWIEEPLDRDNLAGYAALRSDNATSARIAAGEGECGAAGLQRLLEAGCVDVLQPDVTRAGLLAGWAASRAALRAGLRVASHSFTSALNVTAHLHLLVALNDPESWLEWPVTPLAIWREVFADAPAPRAGLLSAPEAPGLGLVPDPAVLARLTCAEA